MYHIKYQLAHIGFQKTFHHNSLGRKKLHYSHEKNSENM